jgi:hypothetical protein
MIKSLLNGILKIVTTLIGFILTPVNALFTNLFPDMSNAISTFNTFVNTYVGGALSYFFSLFPPIFRTLLILWFTFVIAYYSIFYTYKAIIKIFTIIQKIKFW